LRRNEYGVPGLFGRASFLGIMGPPQHDPKKVETVFRKVMLKQHMKS